jgi:hypothetical protein
MFVDLVWRFFNPPHNVLWRHRYINSGMHLRRQTLRTRSDGWFDTRAVPNQVKRLKELEAENARLRRAVSDLTLDKRILAVRRISK